jgi:hypothetical protein
MAGEKDGAVVRVAGLRYWRAADARVVVEAWRRSGEGLLEFAARYGIHPIRLRRWAGQLEAAGEPLGFHPVRLVQSEERAGPSGEPIEIVIGGGCSVRVPPGFGAKDLERVLVVLAAEGRC